MLQPIQFMFLMHILFSGLYNKSACLQVSTRGQGQRSININVFTVILTTRFSNTRFADDHFGLCPYFLLFVEVHAGGQDYKAAGKMCIKKVWNAVYAHGKVLRQAIDLVINDISAQTDQL